MRGCFIEKKSVGNKESVTFNIGIFVLAVKLKVDGCVKFELHSSAVNSWAVPVEIKLDEYESV